MTDLRRNKTRIVKKSITKNTDTGEKRRMTKNDDSAFKNILIIVLIIIALFQAIYIVFYTLNLKENSVKKSFLSSYIKIQKEITTYLCLESADVYQAYNIAQILTGSIVDENGETQKIKDTENTELVPIVDTQNKIDLNGIEYYVASSENIKTTLDISVPSYKGITWYIGSDGDLKVKCESKPKWWTSDLDCLILGN